MKTVDPKTVDDRIVVAIGAPVDEASTEAGVVILGITDGALASMERGHGHDIDLTKIGMPVKIIVMRGATRDAISAKLAEVATAFDANEAGRDTDLGIDK